MHMADALLSPAVGGTMWAVSAGAIAYSSSRIRSGPDEKKVPLMGVLGAFLFAAQMINFTIPATGSSGHLGGGLLLAVLLGPHAAFLTIASVLMVQALFFADGGLLALGCNIFNMGFIYAYIVYPFVYRKILGRNPSQGRMALAIMVSAIIGLQLGPFGVVLETFFSGISELPFKAFLLLMQPIHLAIGIVEGLVTIAVASFVYKAKPEILQIALDACPAGLHPMRKILLSFLAAAILTGGIVSWYASGNPDGLEWAIVRVTGKEELQGSGNGIYAMMAAIQQSTSFLPDYSFRKTASPGERAQGVKQNPQSGKIGTSVSGILGALMTLLLVFATGIFLRRKNPAT